MQLPIYRTAYFLGATVRRTLQLLAVPYRSIARKLGRRGALARGGRSPRHSEIFSRLHRMEDRLLSFERSLSGSSNQSGAVSAARKAQAGGDLSGHVSPELVEALTDPDPGVRRMALGSITEFGGEHTNFLIVEALNDPDPGVRCAAAVTAAQVGTTSAVFSLLLSLDDSAREVRQEAKLAIEKITGKEIDFDPDMKASQRQKKIEKLKKWWKEERFSRLAEEVKTAVKA